MAEKQNRILNRRERRVVRRSPRELRTDEKCECRGNDDRDEIHGIVPEGATAFDCRPENIIGHHADYSEIAITTNANRPTSGAMFSLCGFSLRNPVFSVVIFRSFNHRAH